jgi:hypothetical protein
MKLAKVKTIRLGRSAEFEVVNQPKGKSAYVSEKQNTLTNFQMPNKYGVYGFLAHNYLAGKKFSTLKIVHMISITDEDGGLHNYKIKKIHKYQVLDPKNPRSKFIDLKDNRACTANDLFKRVYLGDHHLVLQTCISKDDQHEWGHMFIIAEPED